jgi:hypothetical protein
MGGDCRNSSSRTRLKAGLSVFRQAVEAVDGATFRWLEGHLALFSAVRTDHLGHLSRAAATIIPGTATRRSAISSVIHLRFSPRLLCRVSSSNPVNNLSPPSAGCRRWGPPPPAGPSAAALVSRTPRSPSIRSPGRTSTFLPCGPNAPNAVPVPQPPPRIGTPGPPGPAVIGPLPPVIAVDARPEKPGMSDGPANGAGGARHARDRHVLPSFTVRDERRAARPSWPPAPTHRCRAAGGGPPRRTADTAGVARGPS